jgi:hypothetical protein
LAHRKVSVRATVRARKKEFNMATLVLTLLDFAMKMITFIRGSKCHLTKQVAHIGGLLVAAGLALIAAAQIGTIDWPWLLAH